MRRADKLELESKQRGRSNATRANLRKRAAALRELANLKHRSERKAEVTKKSVKRGGAKRRRSVRKPDPLTQSLYGDGAGPATLEGLAQFVNQEQPLVSINRGTEQPGRGEIVGGEMHKLTEEIAALARKKGGTDAIQNKLAMATATARYDGECVAEKRHGQNLKDIHEAHTDKVVCSALALFEKDPNFERGFPDAIMVSGYTLARIVDALHRAGYTPRGRR